MTVYPFVRSYEWYLLPEAERSEMLADHGRKGAAFRGAIANTVSAFALGDYEWLLPIESDELTELVDLMRELREHGGAPPRPRGGPVLHRPPTRRITEVARPCWCEVLQ